MSGEDLQFRESAVESVASPDQVNKVAPIASPRLWLLVAAASVVLAAFVSWSLLGTIPLNVRGTGLLIEGTMVVSAESPADGRVAEVRVRAGDSVEQGQVVAIVASPLLEAQLADAVLAAARLREQDRAMTAAEDASIAAATASLEVREREARQRESRAAAAADEFSRSVDAKRDLVRQGLLAEADLLGSVSAQLELERALSESNGRPLRPWLIRIAHNLAANYYRDRSRKPQANIDAIAEPGAVHTTEDLVEGREELRHVLESVQQLPEDRREALIMRFALDMDNREIARAMGKSDGATKVLIHRAIKQLEGIVAAQAEA